MIGQRTALLILIAVQLAAFALFTETLLFPAMAMMIALAGYWGPWQYALNSEQQLMRGLVIGLIFALKWRIDPYSQTYDDMMPYLSPFLHSVGQFALTLQVSAMFLSTEPKWLPITLPWLGVFVMISAGDRTVSSLERAMYQVATIGYIAATALYFSATARTIAGRSLNEVPWNKFITAFVVLASTGAVAWASSNALYRYERALDRLVGEFFSQSYGDSRAGFPNRSRLGDINERKQDQSESIALRVDSPTEPGYLRGQLYHWLEIEPRQHQPATAVWTESPNLLRAPLRPRSYVLPAVATDVDHQVWYSMRLRANPEPGDPARSQDALPPQLPESSRVPESSHAPDSGHAAEARGTLAAGGPSKPAGRNAERFGSMRVWLSDTLWGYYFIPSTAVELVTPEQVVRRDPRGLLTGTESPATSYQVKTSGDLLPDPFFDLRLDTTKSLNRELLTFLPRDFRDDAEIRKIADEIFADCETDEECREQVEAYFRNNYKYTFGIQIPSGEDPLRYFLKNRPPAHCEYFAQAAAALLRFQGIPTRYVTGFVATEYNDLGGFWIARNKHAHAWCEAWDDKLGWVLVEATPPAGVPSPSSVSKVWQAWDVVGRFLMTLRSGFANGGWNWLFHELLVLFSTPAGWLLLLVITGYVGIRVWMGWGRNESPFSPEIQQLHRLLAKMDRYWARRKFVRNPGETLSRFARRLSDSGEHEAAAWYRDYATLRYEPIWQPEIFADLDARHRDILARSASSRGKRPAAAAPAG